MSTEPRYRIGAVARLTGISTHALRIWERRYATVRPGRSDGGDRLYSDADVQRLRSIKRLLGLGHAIGDIATLPTEELAHILELHSGAESGLPKATGTVERYLSHIERMDLASAEQVLAGAALSLERRDFLDGVLVPLLHEVGKRWERGALGVSQEHATSAMVRTQLGALLRLYSADPTAPIAVATTPSGEQHEFGAMLAAVSAALTGWRVVYLGPNLPASEIAQAARVSSADAILLSVVSLDPVRARAELSSVMAGLPPHTAIVVGGRAESAIGELPDRVHRVRDLPSLEQWLLGRIGKRLVG